MGAKLQGKFKGFLPESALKRANKMLKTQKACKALRRLLILKMTNAGYTDKEISSLFVVDEKTIRNIRGKYLNNGSIEEAIYDSARSGKPPEITPEQTQNIIAVACSNPPEGFSRWTLSILQKEVRTRNIVQSISREKLRIILKSNEIKPWRYKMWCVPELTPEFIKRMEDVLNLYSRPYNRREPVICLDEKPITLRASKYADSVKKDCTKQDYEYIRKGTANVFCSVEPLTGKHITKATKKRKGIDFARIIKEISEIYTNTRTIHLIMDNLNTHCLKSLTDAWGVKKGQKIWNKFTVHHTPKHASWLNQAEIAINMFSSTCLRKRKIPSLEILKKISRHWSMYATEQKLKINWKFNVKKAREKFKYDKTGKN